MKLLEQINAQSKSPNSQYEAEIWQRVIQLSVHTHRSLALAKRIREGFLVGTYTEEIDRLITCLEEMQVLVDGTEA